MPKLNSLDPITERFRSQKPLRASSLVITVYGDSIEPHGGTVWLGALIKLLEPMGINERLMRTTIFRLTQEGWLMSDRVGRRSYYSLTGSGRRRFEQAFRRVYSEHDQPWDGSWCLVLTNRLDSEQRKQLLGDLTWQGFATLSGQILGSPNCNTSQVHSILAAAGVEDDVVVFETRPQEELAGRPVRLLTKECWDLQTLGRQYEEFLNHFRPLWQEVSELTDLRPQECFLARTLLIHEYRKLVLRDPLLPDELLPGDWEGRAARQLCRNIYRALTPAAEQWLEESLETAEGPLPVAANGFYKRFGGLK